jgi:hypothetical protein
VPSPDPQRWPPGSDPTARPRPVRSEADRTGRVVAVGWDGVAYQTLAGEDRVGWKKLRAAPDAARTLSARHFWARVLAEAIEAATLSGKARVAVRNLGGPESDIDALTWVAVAVNMAGERPRDLAAPAGLFTQGGRAAAFANAEKLRESLEQLGYEVAGPSEGGV